MAAHSGMRAGSSAAGSPIPALARYATTREGDWAASSGRDRSPLRGPPAARRARWLSRPRTGCRALTCYRSSAFLRGRSLLKFAGLASERGQAGRAQRMKLLEGGFRGAGAQRQFQAGGEPFQGLGVVADVAVLEAGLDIDPDVVGIVGAGLLPQRPGLRLVPGAHQLLSQLAQHLGALGVAPASGIADRGDRVVDPAEREIAVGKILAPWPDVEPRLAVVGARQRQILLQRGGPLGVIVTGPLHPVHALFAALLQRRGGGI